MIKILIVDDEPFIRQGLKILIKWEEYGYQIVGEASNGKEAIKQLENNEIDLIISDIKMPEMNGLELIQYVRENISTKIKFIVLSGFYEFEYAKKAIKYNVIDYILKPIQKEELIKVLNNLKEELLNQKSNELAEKTKDKVVYDRYVSAVLSEKYDESTLSYVKKHLNCIGQLRYIIIEMNYCDIDISHEEKRKGQSNLYEYMIQWLGKNYHHAIFDISKDKNCYDIGFIYNKKLAEEKSINEKEYILKLKNDIKQMQSYDFYIYIGQKVDNVEELSTSYKSATVAKVFSEFSNGNGVTYYDEMIEEKTFSCSIEKQYIDNLIHVIEENNEEEIINCVDKVYASFKECVIDLDIIRMNMSYLLYNLINIAKELDSDANQKEVIQYISLGSFEQMISRGSSKHLKEFSLEFSRYLNQLRQHTFQGVLSHIDKEIAEHYMKKLSLKYLSEKYYINSAYLGQVFKKQYNVSFKDYLNAYRIEKSAELLKRSDEKVYKIAERVGYNNTDYYINKFVQLKGITPLQYRKQFIENK